MLPNLNAHEARVLGCLMEKSVTTPDQFPLTLNALTNACNQKSGRDPVMSLDKGAVQRAARELAAKHLVTAEENFKTGVVKFRQRFCNTRYSDYQFDAAQFAIVTLLLLRSAQTPGELRARSGRLHTFADNSAVVDALTGLIEREGEPLVVQLVRTPGRKDSEYMHLFSGPIDAEKVASAARAARTEQATDTPGATGPAGATGATDRVSVSALAERVSVLESEVAELRELLAGAGTAPR